MRRKMSTRWRLVILSAARCWSTFVSSSKTYFMLPIKTTLLVNGISSGVTGIGLIAIARTVAGIFGVSQSAPFAGTGIFLVLFAMLVVSAGLKKTTNPSTVRLITALDLLWVVASVILVIADGRYFSFIGNVLIVAVAAWVGMMAILQRQWLKKQSATPVLKRSLTS